MQVVCAELEAAKLQVSTLKAELVISHEAADSGRAASDSLAQHTKKSADSELSKAVQKVDAAEAEAHRLQGLLANTEADGKSEAAKLQVLLEKSQADVASAEQEVKRLEQQLAGTQAAAAQKEEELKKVHKAQLQSEVQVLCISLPLLYCACLPGAIHPTCAVAPALLYTLTSLATNPLLLGSPAAHTPLHPPALVPAMHRACEPRSALETPVHMLWCTAAHVHQHPFQDEQPLTCLSTELLGNPLILLAAACADMVQAM